MLKPYCYDCKSYVRGTQAVHMTTKRHFNSTRPPIRRWRQPRTFISNSSESWYEQQWALAEAAEQEH